MRMLICLGHDYVMYVCLGHDYVLWQHEICVIMVCYGDEYMNDVYDFVGYTCEVGS